MHPSSWLDGDSGSRLQVVWEDNDRAFCRGWRNGADGDPHSVLIVRPFGEPPTRDTLNRLRHEYGLKDDLDDAWAVRPLELVHERGQTMLVLSDPGGEPLDRLLGCGTLVISDASTHGQVALPDIPRIEDTHRRMATELGVGPGRDLRRLHGQVVAGDPELETLTTQRTLVREIPAAEATKAAASGASAPAGLAIRASARRRGQGRDRRCGRRAHRARHNAAADRRRARRRR